jgi:hypothetical protein
MLACAAPSHCLRGVRWLFNMMTSYGVGDTILGSNGAIRLYKQRNEKKAKWQAGV